MAGDRMSDAAVTWWADAPEDARGVLDAARRLAAEVVTLRRWKAEAEAVLEQLDAAWERVGKPGRLGYSKPDGMAAEIVRLWNEIGRLRSVGDAIHRDCIRSWAEESERLRAAGDRLASLLGEAVGHADQWRDEHDALDAWREARR